MSQLKIPLEPRYPYQAHEDKIVIEVDPVENESFGQKADEDREKGNNQAEPDEYFEEGAQVILGNNSASHGQKSI